MYPYTYIRKHACMHACIHPSIHTYMYICAYIKTYIHAHICTRVKQVNCVCRSLLDEYMYPVKYGSSTLGTVKTYAAAKCEDKCVNVNVGHPAQCQDSLPPLVVWQNRVVLQHVHCKNVRNSRHTYIACIHITQ